MMFLVAWFWFIGLVIAYSLGCWVLFFLGWCSVVLCCCDFASICFILRACVYYLVFELLVVNWCGC